MKVYLTHCCAKKNELARTTGIAMPPEEMYIEPDIQKFFSYCLSHKLAFGVLSDLYGIWLSPEKKRWYEKSPDTVTDVEKAEILRIFDHELSRFSEIIFLIRPESFHPFYDFVLSHSKHTNRIRRITELKENV